MFLMATKKLKHRVEIIPKICKPVKEIPKTALSNRKLYTIWD